MFQQNDKIYTDENIHVEGEDVASFLAFTSYDVYEVENDEKVILGEDGMLHSLTKLSGMFSYAH